MTHDPAVTDRPLRRDARANRARILAAAAQAFADEGPGVSLVEIARRAEVGYATVHRNFTKDQLIEELFGAWFERRRAVAEAALLDPDPWHALVTFLADVLAEDGTRNYAMGALFALRPAWRTQTRELTHDLLTRAQTAGAARADLTATDVTIAVIGVGRMMAVTDGSSTGLWQRQLAIVLDGMRAVHREPLPGPAPDGHQFDESINTWSSEFLRAQPS